MTETSGQNNHTDKKIEYCQRARSRSATVQNDAGTTDTFERPRTPLPKFQLFLALLIQFAEPISATVIYPFINQFVRDTDIINGDERKTGYYAGIIESAFFLAEAATVFQWGRLSDRFGRRPILLLGPLGVAFAMFRFGYSTSFWPMFWSRCTQGIFNGNIGVSKTIMVELTDTTNIGEAFALIPVMWSTGTTIAPIMGGVLSNPAQRWPNVFGKITLFKEHPYFLPCLVASAFSFLIFLAAFLGLKEASTHPSFTDSGNLDGDKERRRNSITSHASSSDTLLGQNDTPNYGSTSTRCPSPTLSEVSLGSLNSESPTLSSVLKSRKMQTIFINFVFLAFTDMCLNVLTPLVFSTSIQFGGLGLTAYDIGLIMGIWGFLNAFMQIYLLGKMIRKYGPGPVYKVTYACYLICFLSYPVSTYLARRNGAVGLGSCLSVLVQLFFQLFSFMAYTAISVIIAESAPKSLLGSINGLVQMCGCVMRTLAPTVASSLFSMSVQDQILGGNLVYMVLCSIVSVGIIFSHALTDHKFTGKSH